MQVDNNDPVDVPCTVGEAGGEVREINFELNNLEIYYVSNAGNWATGVFQIEPAGEHSHTYQVVNVKTPAPWVTNPELPWTNGNAGTLTLVEPLTLAQLQAGGLIAVIERDGVTHNVPCTVVVDDNEVRQIKWMIGESIVYDVNVPGNYETGIFEIHYEGDHSHVDAIKNFIVNRG